MRSSLPRAALPLLLLTCVPRHSAATGFALFPASVPPSQFFSSRAAEGPDAPRRLFPASPWRAIDFGLDTSALRALQEPASSPLGASREPRLFTTSTTWTTAGVLVAMSAWAALGVEKDEFTPWMFTQEKFFGEDTYSGGADKCSHIVLSAFLARELGWAYEKQGHSRDRSLMLSLGVTVLAGVIQEVGDAFTPYGYSWEDIVADVAGGVTGVALSHYELNDLIGLRFGLVSSDIPDNACCTESLGENYSNEFYSGDLKLAGLAKRLKIKPGPARFFLLSATYSTKAYGFEPARPDRQRNVGIDLGLNIPEILSAVGVPETTWWGTILYKALNVFRIPFTAFGFRYDLNHHQWHGPDTGQKFD